MPGSWSQELLGVNLVTREAPILFHFAQFLLTDWLEA